MKALMMLPILFLISCGGALQEKIEETYPDNTPKKVSYYKELDGKEQLIEQKEFHDNGQLKMYGKFVHGNRSGKWIAYFENGQIQSEGTFIDNERTGKSTVYYPNGSKRFEGEYHSDKQSGHWKFYNQDGALIQEKDF